MPLAPGTKLGPYEIQSPLGAGGMGEVYRARDTRLGRDVAIKVLPGAVANDSDRLRRFEQEARTIAALSHPNILGIHDIGSYDEKAGSIAPMRVAYAQGSKTYVYSAVRILGSLYIVEGLE